MTNIYIYKELFIYILHHKLREAFKYLCVCPFHIEYSWSVCIGVHQKNLKEFLFFGERFKKNKCKPFRFMKSYVIIILMNFQLIRAEYQNLSKYIFLLDIQTIARLINKHGIRFIVYWIRLEYLYEITGN